MNATRAATSDNPCRLKAEIYNFKASIGQSRFLEPPGGGVRQGVWGSGPPPPRLAVWKTKSPAHWRGLLSLPSVSRASLILYAGDPFLTMARYPCNHLHYTAYP